MSDRILRALAASALSFGAAAAFFAASPATAESWETRCSGYGDAGICVQTLLASSEQALLAAVSERRTELRRAPPPGVDPWTAENAQIQWMADTQNGCAARAEDSASGEFDLVFGRCLAESYEARRLELEASVSAQNAPRNF